MRRALRLAALAGWLGLGACADATGDKVVVPAPDGGALGDAAAMPDARVVDLPPAGQPAYIDVTLAPRVEVYDLGDAPQVVAVAYDRDDVALTDAITLTVEPPEAATVDGQTLAFHAEGAGAVRACAGDVCGLAHFFVDDAPPELIVESPTPGARIIGEPRILVTGDVIDTGTVAVYVNDQPARVGANGRFSAEIDARFGLNRIDVVADDGAHDPPSRAVLEVLWAPDTLPVEATGVRVEDALLVRIDQTQLDADVAPEAGEGGAVTAIDFAGALEAMVERLDAGALVTADLPQGDPLTLQIAGVDLGATQIELNLESDGVSLFARLPRATITTAGSLRVDNIRYGLDGEIYVAGAAYARLTFSLPPGGPPTLRVSATRIAIESIAGALRDERAQALVETLGSVVREAIEGYADDVVRALIDDSIGDLLAGLLAQGLAALGTYPLPPPIDGVSVGFALTEPRFQRRTDLTLALAAEIRQDVDVEAPHVDRGVAGEALSEGPPWPADGRMGIALRLVAINAVLHEVWRRGSLQLDLAGLIPGDLPLLQNAQIDARLPPIVVPGEPGGPFALVAQIGEVDLFLRGPSNGALDHYVLSLRAGIVVDTAGGALRLDVTDEPDVRVALKSSEGPRPLLTPEGLQTLILRVVWPQVRGAIGAGLTLPTDAVIVDGAAFGLGDLVVQPNIAETPLVRAGWLMLPAELTLRLE